MDNNYKYDDIREIQIGSTKKNDSDSILKLILAGYLNNNDIVKRLEVNYKELKSQYKIDFKKIHKISNIDVISKILYIVLVEFDNANILSKISNYGITESLKNTRLIRGEYNAIIDLDKKSVIGLVQIYKTPITNNLKKFGDFKQIVYSGLISTHVGKGVGYYLYGLVLKIQPNLMSDVSLTQGSLHSWEKILPKLTNVYVFTNSRNKKKKFMKYEDFVKEYDEYAIHEMVICFIATPKKLKL